MERQHIKAKITRAMYAGPYHVTKDAIIAEWSHDGSLSILREGTNEWACFPGDENEIGNVPMACDPMGLQWIKDIIFQRPAPTNIAPGLVYMLCGATQHSDDTPFDKESPEITIGSHYMICWPFNSKLHGFPSNIRDSGMNNFSTSLLLDSCC